VKNAREFALFVILGLVLVTELGHGLPNRGMTWAPDGDPLIPLIFAKRVLLGGWNSGWHTPYPDFHRFVLLAFQAPYMVVHYFSGNLDGLNVEGGYPYGIKDFDVMYAHLALITRGVSALMALGMVFWVIRIGRSLFPDRPAVFGGILAGFAPTTVYYVHTETLDIPMLFWLSAAIFCYVRVLQTFELKYYVWLAILAAISTATKDYAYGAFALMPIPLVWALANRDPAGTGRVLSALTDRRHCIALITFVIAFAIAENVLWNPSGFANHVILAAGASDTQQTITTSFVPNDFSVSGRLAQFVGTMPFVLGWCGLPICLAGIALAALRRSQALSWLAWPMFGLYLFSVVPVLPSDPTLPGGTIERPFMPIGLICAVFGGQLLSSFWCASNRQTLGRVLCALCVLLVVANGSVMLLTLSCDTRYRAEEWFNANVPEGAIVDLHGYRSMSPRLQVDWQQQVVNQKTVPEGSDIQITSESQLLERVKERSPDVIVVAEPFARTWRAGKQSKKELASAYQEFFQLLEDGELGYTRSMHFKPFLGFLFGMPDHRRLVPAITLYEYLGDERCGLQFDQELGSITRSCDSRPVPNLQE
jgi:hypothetical protein